MRMEDDEFNKKCSKCWDYIIKTMQTGKDGEGNPVVGRDTIDLLITLILRFGHNWLEVCPESSKESFIHDFIELLEYALQKNLK